MEAFNCHSYLRRCHSDSRPETPSQSDSSTRQVFSDEEVFINVASKNPKRRAGRKKFRETRHPVYRGVRQRNNGKWVCEVREPNKKSRIWLGTFPSPEMAARAHDVAAMALRGRSACLNFADSVWLLPVPVSAEAKEIQKTAAEAAEAFRPSLQSDVESAGEDANQTNLSPSPMDEEAAEAYRNSSQSDAASAGEDRNLTNLPPLLGNASYMDEEAVLDMPKLLADMAQGLLLSPQSCGSRFHWDDVDTAADVSLWSYSI